MRSRFLALSAILYFMTVALCAQNLAGKWETDKPQNGGGAPAGQANQAVIFDLKTEADNRISGTVTEAGSATPVTITEGTVTGKTFMFKTEQKTYGVTTFVTWNGEMKDDNTLSVTRIARRLEGVAPRGRGGFAGGAPVDPIRTAPPAPP